MDSSVTAPCLSPSDVMAVIDAAAKKPHHTGGLHNKTRTNPLARRCKIVWLHPPEIRPVFQKVFTAIETANQSSWQIDFDALEAAQYTEYSFLGHYGRHIDLGDGPIARRKISASVNLSSPASFGGGRLTTWRGPTSNKLGEITIFPSYLPHKVSPVWWGKRRSLVFWATGEKYK